MFIKDYIDGLPITVAHDNFDEYNMHVLAAPNCNYYEELCLRLFMFPT